MDILRRAFLRRAGEPIASAALMLVASPRAAHAGLYGTWKLRCPHDKTIDRVDDGTRQHLCDLKKHQVFEGNTVTVVCRNGHDNRIDTGKGLVDSYPCSTCKTECRWTELERKPTPTPPSDKGKR